MAEGGSGSSAEEALFASKDVYIHDIAVIYMGETLRMWKEQMRATMDEHFGRQVFTLICELSRRALRTLESSDVSPAARYLETPFFQRNSNLLQAMILYNATVEETGVPPERVFEELQNVVLLFDEEFDGAFRSRSSMYPVSAFLLSFLYLRPFTLSIDIFEIEEVEGASNFSTNCLLFRTLAAVRGEVRETMKSQEGVRALVALLPHFSFSEEEKSNRRRRYVKVALFVSYLEALYTLLLEMVEESKITRPKLQAFQSAEYQRSLLDYMREEHSTLQGEEGAEWVIEKVENVAYRIIRLGSVFDYEDNSQWKMHFRFALTLQARFPDVGNFITRENTHFSLADVRFLVSSCFNNSHSVSHFARLILQSEKDETHQKERTRLGKRRLGKGTSASSSSHHLTPFAAQEEVKEVFPEPDHSEPHAPSPSQELIKHYGFLIRIVLDCTYLRTLLEERDLEHIYEVL